MKRALKIREAGAVQRYHTVRTIHQQSVAEHSWGVAQLVLELVSNPSTELLKAALNHDLPEVLTGDLPAPIKRANGYLKQITAKLELDYHREMGTHFAITDYERQVLKFADYADLVLWCIEETNMGNKNAQIVLDNGLAYLKEMQPFSTEAMNKMYAELLAVV